MPTTGRVAEEAAPWASLALLALERSGSLRLRVSLHTRDARMTDEERKARIGDYCVEALKQAISSAHEAKTLMVCFVITQTQDGEDSLARIAGYRSMEESVNVARALVAERANELSLYAIAFIGAAEEGRYDFAYAPIEDVKAALAAGQQPAIIVEAADDTVSSGATMTANILETDDGQLTIATKISGYSTHPNWLLNSAAGA